MVNARSGTTPVDAVDHRVVGEKSCHLRKSVRMWVIESFDRKEDAAGCVGKKCETGWRVSSNLDWTYDVSISALNSQRMEMSYAM